MVDGGCFHPQNATERMGLTPTARWQSPPLALASSLLPTTWGAASTSEEVILGGWEIWIFQKGLMFLKAKRAQAFVRYFDTGFPFVNQEISSSKTFVDKSSSHTFPTETTLLADFLDLGILCHWYHPPTHPRRLRDPSSWAFALSTSHSFSQDLPRSGVFGEFQPVESPLPLRP